MSIDLYPDLDATENRGSPARGLGAASLLHRNNDEIWPEFSGCDLLSADPAAEHVNFALDGALIGNVTYEQCHNIPANAQLITVSAGGNDLLVAYGESAAAAKLRQAVRGIIARYGDMVTEIRRRAPDALLILTTVYDPTDGTGNLGEGWNDLPLEFLDEFNASVRSVGSKLENVEVADVHAHFMGHGITAKGEDRWYWPHSIIEPSARGASEIRRLWREIVPTDNH